jgi:hypothetical protein
LDSGSIGSSLINIGEEVKVGNEPEHAVPAAAGNLGENTRILQVTNYSTRSGKGHTKPLLSRLHIDHRLLE